jgi:predicted RNase H-like nuclease (RuvC/YqgF family)
MSETEREIEAREECARRGIDPDEICADGGVTAWMVVDQERWRPTNDLASELTAAKAECDNLRRTLGEKSRQMDAQIAALRSIASKAAARIEALEAALREARSSFNDALRMTDKAAARIEALEAALANERERCIAVCESWIGTFQKYELKHTGAREYAVDAIGDIIEVIREGTDPRAALDKDAGI